MTFSLSVFFSLKVMAHLPRKTEVRSAFYKFNFFLMKDVLEKIFVLFYKWVRSRYFFWRTLFTTLYLPFFWMIFDIVKSFWLATQAGSGLFRITSFVLRKLEIFGLIIWPYSYYAFTELTCSVKSWMIGFFTSKWDNHVILYLMICGCHNQVMLWISNY